MNAGLPSATRLGGLILVLAFLGAGCGQIFTYPDTASEGSATACSDGKDNDLDGKTDCQDADCKAYCGENTDATCHDGQDNDADGDLDCQDPECQPYCVENTQTTCRDGVDNDQNGKTDCGDAACGKFCPEADAQACSDGVDNDFDGKIDCDDPDCDGLCPEETQEACADGRDNDGDGVVDGADPQCWLLSPPEVERCEEASGVDLVDTFDAGPQWSFYGSPWGGSALFRDSHQGPPPTGRQDFLAAFSTPTNADATLGWMTGQQAFSGSWQGFEFSFSASVPPDTKLRAAIVPIKLAPVLNAQGSAAAAPMPGAATASFSVTVDATHVPPMFALNVEGADYTAYPEDLVSAYPEGSTSGVAEDFSEVKVVLDEHGFYATLTRPNGNKAELRAPPPNSLTLGPSRLVFWGGSAGVVTEAALDDVRLHVSADQPCGFASPQIPGAACGLDDKLRAFGNQVSVAHGDADQQCALVEASPDVEDPSQFLTDKGATLTAWSSADGEAWALDSSPQAPPVDLPAGAQLVGAGIAHDSQGWQVVVAYREADGVRLGLASGTTCGRWGPLAPGPLLPSDAEPPSYVIAGGRQDVYFTLPPGTQTGRTLWRVTRADPQSTWLEPEFLVDLPPSVGSPVTIQQVGTRDLVLVHPAAPDLNGVGLLVSNADARSWRSVGPSPLLTLPDQLPNPREGQLVFDELVESAALSWRGNAGFLLYGTRLLVGQPQQSLHLSVGTARLVPAGLGFPEPIPARQGSCGDGRCDPRETCSICPADCSCGTAPLLTNVFTRDAPWEIVSSDPNPAATQYLDPEHEALNWAGGADAWSVLPLKRSITGDFELSFDYLRNWIDPTSLGVPSCALYIGLGTVPNFVTPAAANGATAETGIFARLSESHCFPNYVARPSVHVDSTVFEDQNETLGDPYGCLLERYLTPGKRRKMRLRREGYQVSLGVARDDGCGFAERTINYSGALPDLPALLVGFGGGDFAGCAPRAGAGTITNLELRLLDDPQQCSGTKELCGGGSQEPSCVDTANSVEHCGACGHACAASEVCKNGTCAADVTNITWLAFDDSARARSDQAPNGDLGIDGLLFNDTGPCAVLNWDPQTRCATGTLCSPGVDFNNWGISLNFNFRTTGDPGSPLTLPWDPNAVGARGIAWEISGSAPGLQLWVLNMDPVWNGRCTSLLCDLFAAPDGTPSPALHGQLYFDQMVKDDWGTNGGLHYTFDPKAAFALQFKLPSAGSANASFAFCIDRLGIIR